MTSSNCLLQQIRDELRIMNNRIQIRCNVTAIIEIDTSNIKTRTYNIQKIFNTPKNIYATQLTILDTGGGFYLNINNTGNTNVSVDYEIDNEEIRNIDIYGSGYTGIGKIRIGANI